MTIKPLAITLAAALLSQPVAAATVPHWSGATENACQGRCPQDWAESQLTKDELAALHAEQQRNPAPYRIQVRDGDVFDLMTYYKNGEPKAYRTSTVARLDAPEGAEGWDMGGWAWVKLDACQNWAILRKVNVGTGTSAGVDSLLPVETMPALFAAAFIPASNSAGSSWTGGGGTDWPSPVVTTPDCTACIPVPPCPPISAVPVPATALLLLTALAGLIWAKRKGGAP